MGFGEEPGRDENSAVPKKLSFIRYFFALGAAGALLAAFFDHLEGYYVVSSIEVLVGGLSLSFLLYSRYRVINTLEIKITVLLVFVLFSVAAFMQMDSVISLVWVPAYPIVFFFLTSFRSGLFWSVLTFLAITAAYLVHPYWREDPRVPLEAFMQTIAAYIFVGALAFFYELVRSRQEQLLQQQADYDYLTGVFNRRALTYSMDSEISRVERYGTRLSMLLMDLDDFKSVNDRYGHKRGDYVLQEICRITRQSIRQSDILARWGGEEFAILMPEAGVEQAASLAEKLRAIIAAHHFEGAGQVTVSIGVAQYQAGEPDDELLQRVDDALYRAKAADKNRVEIALFPGLTGPETGNPARDSV